MTISLKDFIYLVCSIGTGSLNFEHYARSENFEGEKLLAVF